MYNYNDYNDYLMHYGIKGMKWGVRKRPEFQTDGSDKTVKKLHKFLDADKKYGPIRNAMQDRKVNKLYDQYDKSVAKDIKRAVKTGNTEAVNSMAAGRTYLRSMMDQGFLNNMISDAAIQANVEYGKDFTYNILRDNNMGGVRVTVNDHSSVYTYMPEFKTNRLRSV